MRLIFVFFFLEENVRDVLFSQKYIYFWELYVSGNYKKIRLDFLAQLVRAIGC